MAPSFVRSLLSLSYLASLALAAPLYELAPRSISNSNKQVIVQLFQWNWDSIAAECTNFLGPAAYGFVQVSTASEHIQGSQWWTDYQVVSYQIISKRGNSEQFQNMVQTCKNAGVGIIVDVVLNHMASGTDQQQTGIAGTTYSHYSYNGLYTSDDFHYCGTQDNAIQDWNDAHQVQYCQLEDLADLNTESSSVQSKLAAYMNSFIDLGAAGFRIDASKHVPVDDEKAIFAQLKDQSLYMTHEVVYTDNGPGVTSQEYTPYGDVQEFRYPIALYNAFSGGNLASLNQMESGWLASGSANVFVVNHDLERSPNYLTYQSNNGVNGPYTLAQVFSLAYPYGTKTVLSSYAFSSTDDGAPNGNAGSCSGPQPQNGWNCQHRWTAVAGMVGFANAVGSAPLQNWTQGNNNQIAFARGNAGYVIINNDGGNWSSSFNSGLPDGTYCDVISAALSNGSCTGASATVSGGTLNANVNGVSAFAIHIGAKLG